MLCQNCKRKNADVHLKRIVGGESAEVHLCSGCAAALGVRDAVQSFSPFGDMFENMRGANSSVMSANRVLRCETCGFSFEDIARTGSAGCPDCYRVFSAKLKATVVKLHGRAVFKGTPPENITESDRIAEEISVLRARLEKAVNEEDFETAAQLRDEIRAIMNREEK